MNIDVAEVKESISALTGLLPFNQKFTFFYDETGNCRKFSLTKNGVNSLDALKYNFILGGVAYEGDVNNADFEKLKQVLHFQKNQKELKFKHLYKNNKDFLSFMNKTYVTDFLQWIYESELYIHYSTLNNLYYSIVDIVDSLFGIDQSFDLGINFIFQIKDALYNFVIEHTEEIIDLFIRYSYPNISDCKNFCGELCDLIYTYNNEDEFNPGFFLEMLRQMLKQAGKENSLIFVQDNEPFILIEEYYLFYLERCEILSKSTHIFDEELTVQEKIKDVNLIECGEKINNYCFVKSHENNYVQVSDLIVGLLSKLFSFLDEHSVSTFLKWRYELTDTQIKNFCMIYYLISKSDDRCKLFLKNANAISNIDGRINKLQILTKEVLPYEL